MSEREDSYLWDKSGPVDPEVERLEMLLAPYRCPEVPPLPASPRPLRIWLYAGAAIAAALGVVWFTMGRASDNWTVAVLSGEARLGSRTVSGSARMTTGQVFETEAGAQAQIRMPRGRLEVEPETALRLVESERNTQRISLLRGTIHARVMAPPRVFIVDTPSAVATDLGCAYTLHIDPSGDGMLRVTHGWIEFEWKGRDSLVPTGAVAVTKAGAGPGTPFFEDTSDAFKTALAAYDFPAWAEQRPRALEAVLSAAGPHDAVSLLNLVRNAPGDARGAVYDRLAGLVTPPAGANRDAAIAGEPHALDAWWPAVGIGRVPGR
ncbi:MAG TPA: FecR family protein [Bryobacteraceae bacterium]|nr:FecR family protein [Bryobacteraceae bacterium]